MTKVKICGLKELQHVQVVVEAGADAIGFVFAPSKRRVSISEAKELAKDIPSHVAKVGVFVNATIEELKQTFREVPLDFVQLHGDESAELIQEAGLPSIKAVSVHSVEDVERANRYEADYILFDTPGTEFRGGSGVTFDWKLMNGAGVSADRVILAGGLNAENVGEAIRRVKPYMVDVSSGVERNGRKDEQLIRTFVQAVKEEES